MASALGWADPPPSEAAVRGAVLAGLPVVSGVVAHREAAALADLTARDLEAVAGGDVGAARPALARFGARSWDPVAATLGDAAGILSAGLGSAAVEYARVDSVAGAVFGGWSPGGDR